MKKIYLLFVFLLASAFMFSGCLRTDLSTVREDAYDDGRESGYDAGYDDGYNEGYDDGVESVYADEDLQDIYVAIAELMYDHEYRTVEILMDYCPSGVKAALSLEFGKTDISAVIKYLENRHQLAIGICDICGETVMSEDAVLILPDGIECAHFDCTHSQGQNYAYIERNP